MNRILESSKYVVEKSQQVYLNHDRIALFAKGLELEHFPYWLDESPIHWSNLETLEKKLDFLIIFNSISFCYWGEPKWAIRYRESEYDGSWGMIASIMRAMEEHKPILDSQYRANMTEEEFSSILRGNIQIPLLRERWEITRSIARSLVEKYSGRFISLIETAENSAHRMFDLILDLSESFSDTSIYCEEKIYFYKRAQILVEDINHLLVREGSSPLMGIGDFTACADYKLPQVMRRLGLFSYSAGLAEKIDGFSLLQHHSPEEVEIRANTIWVVELIRQVLLSNGKAIHPSQINDLIWLMGKDRSQNTKPHHRTLTTAY